MAEEVWVLEIGVHGLEKGQGVLQHVDSDGNTCYDVYSIADTTDPEWHVATVEPDGTVNVHGYQPYDVTIKWQCGSTNTES